MKAITQQEYGDAGVLRLTDIDAPAAPGKGEVLVDVRAVGVGPETIHIVAGDPLMVRLGTGIRRPRKKVPGRDVAGVVVLWSADMAASAQLAGGLSCEVVMAPFSRPHLARICL